MCLCEVAAVANRASFSFKIRRGIFYLYPLIKNFLLDFGGSSMKLHEVAFFERSRMDPGNITHSRSGFLQFANHAILYKQVCYPFCLEKTGHSAIVKSYQLGVGFRSQATALFSVPYHTLKFFCVHPCNSAAIS